MYFSGFPKGLYDINGDGNFKLVTEINSRLVISSNLTNDVFLYTKYDVIISVIQTIIG